MTRAIALLALLLWGVAARAEDNPACARFEAPLAYNACLARQGPAARATRALPAPRGETARPGRRPTVTRTARGRVHAVFTIR